MTITRGTTTPSRARQADADADAAALTTRVDIAIRGIRVAAPVHREGGAGPSDDGHVMFRDSPTQRTGTLA